MLTSEIWSMLEIWMLIPTVTGLPETQMDWIRIIFKLSSYLLLQHQLEMLRYDLKQPHIPQVSRISKSHVLK